jgi:hypothetical protein
MGMNRGPSKKRIQDLIELARKHGLKYLKAGEVEFELSPGSATSKLVDNGTPETETKVEREPTEDEMLNYSSPFYDQIRADRSNS